MVLRLIFNGLLMLLSVRTRRQLLYKPAITFLLVYALRFTAEAAVSGINPDRIADELVITAIVAAPFLMIGMWIVSHMESLHDRLAALAATDVLTELPNRRAFMAELEEAIHQGSLGHLLLLDADHFKRVNDTHGHAAGDACLVRIAAQMRVILDQSTALGRLGGEEFGALIPPLSSADMHSLGIRLSAPISVVAPDSGDTFDVTLSIGAAQLRGGETSSTLFERADKALYAAKSSGRARMVLESDTPTPFAA
ncbi:GGDEF domain-containing protein [Yoonia sp. R2331]|uniref:GGDEF domain-containing protein n=1 Tax=Yoonia sp. R2331 TaxID=3237238 RepID=UPI0034E3A723